MSPTQADPTGAEAMAGDSSSMATPSSDEKGAQGQSAVPGSPDGRIGLEVVSASGGGGLQHAQGHQEVDRGGSGLELVPAGQPQVYGPTASTGMAEVNPFWSDKVKDDVALRAIRPTFLPVEGNEGFGGGGRELVSPPRGAGSDGLGSPEMNYMVKMMALENQRLQHELGLMRGCSGGPCGSQSLPLGQVQRSALPVYGGGQEARTLPGGSVLQGVERVGLSLLGMAGMVTDQWTSGGGGSNVKSNLLQPGFPPPLQLGSPCPESGPPLLDGFPPPFCDPSPDNGPAPDC